MVLKLRTDKPSFQWIVSLLRMTKTFFGEVANFLIVFYHHKFFENHYLARVHHPRVKFTQIGPVPVSVRKVSIRAQVESVFTYVKLVILTLPRLNTHSDKLNTNFGGPVKPREIIKINSRGPFL